MADAFGYFVKAIFNSTSRIILSNRTKEGKAQLLGHRTHTAIVGFLALFFICVSIIVPSSTSFSIDSAADLVENSQILSETENVASDSLILPAVEVTLVVDAFDIDVVHFPRHANVCIWAFFEDFPYNASSIGMEVYRGSVLVSFQCNRTLGTKDYWGKFDTTWAIEGIGESYPFDAYDAVFNLPRYISAFDENTSSYIYFLVNLKEPCGAWLKGPLSRSLADTWRHTGWGEADGKYEYPLPFKVIHSEDGGDKLVVNFMRIPLAPFLEFVFPILACAYLLGATLFLENSSDRSTRLRIYSSFFVFTPIFFFAMQKFLPSRWSLSVPELLLVSLMTGSILFTFASIMPSRKKCILGLETRYWDLFALVALTLFLFLAMLSIPLTWTSVVIIAVVEVGYLFRYVFFILSKVWSAIVGIVSAPILSFIKKRGRLGLCGILVSIAAFVPLLSGVIFLATALLFPSQIPSVNRFAFLLGILETFGALSGFVGAVLVLRRRKFAIAVIGISLLLLTQLVSLVAILYPRTFYPILITLKGFLFWILSMMLSIVGIVTVLGSKGEFVSGKPPHIESL